MPIKNPPLKWHGGKHYMAKEIIKRFPPHTHYVEPFFGGGAVLLAKPNEWIEGYSEVVNDINHWLVNFWCCLKYDSMFQQFRRIVEHTPFAKWEFESSRNRNSEFTKKIALFLNEDVRESFNVGEGARFFIRYRQSRQGLGTDFATLSRNRTRRGMNEQVSSWLSAIEGLPEAHERLKRVVILNDDALKVIKQQDGPNTLFYCDPPYLHETRTTTNDYEHEMDISQHKELLMTLAGIKGKFILSGYHSVLYDTHAKEIGWRCDEIKIDNKASSKKKKDIKTECLWMNFFLCEDCRKEIDQCEFDAFGGCCEPCAFNHC